MSYEFDSSENEVFIEVGARITSVVTPLGLLAVVHLGLGVWLIDSGAGGGNALALCSILLGGLALLFCVWLRQIAARFRLIVSTEGSDMEHLDNAIEINRKLFLSASYLVAGFTIGLMIMVAEKFATLV